MPTGLAATDDDLWVGDWATGMVLQIVADGQLLPDPLPVATDLAFPEGLAVAPNGNLLVVETGAGRLVSIYLETGEVSTVAEGFEWGLVGSGAPPPYIFSGIAVGASGAIYVTGDVANVLYRIEEPTAPVDRRTVTGPPPEHGGRTVSSGRAGGFREPAAKMVPVTYSLAPNVPNPFNPITHIGYDLPAAGWVRVVIYDVRGAQVRRLVDRHHKAGRYQTNWTGIDDEGRGVASGVYTGVSTGPKAFGYRRVATGE